MKEGRRKRNGYDQDEQILVGNQEQVEKNKTTYATQKTGEEKGGTGTRRMKLSALAHRMFLTK